MPWWVWALVLWAAVAVVVSVVVGRVIRAADRREAREARRVRDDGRTPPGGRRVS
ncbi:hypothetical protein ACI798_17815 [Geodermatophilus sp. SYSU D01045]